MWRQFNVESSDEERETNDQDEAGHSSVHIEEVIEAVMRTVNETSGQTPQRKPTGEIEQHLIDVVNSIATSAASNPISDGQSIVTTRAVAVRNRRKNVPTRKRIAAVEHPIAASLHSEPASASTLTGRRVHAAMHKVKKRARKPKIATVPDIGNSHNGTNDRNVWSDEEKQRLLEAIKIYGSQDVLRLKKVVRTRSITEIMEFIGRQKDLSGKIAAGTEHRSSTSNTPSRNKRTSVRRMSGLGISASSTPLAADLSSNANILTTMQQYAKSCPDSKLEEWQRVAGFVLINGIDHSAPTVRKVLTDRASEEDVTTVETSSRSQTRTINFGRIYSHLADAIDGKQRVQLMPQEKRIVQYVIQDLANCIRGTPHLRETQGYFNSILTAFRRNSLVPQRTANSETLPAACEETLCSLNPFCIPSSLVLEQLVPHRRVEHEMVYASSSTMGGDGDEGYRTASSIAMSSSQDSATCTRMM